MTGFGGAGVDADLPDVLSGGRGPVSVRFRLYQVNLDASLVADLSSALVPESSVVEINRYRAITRSARLRLIAANLPDDFDPLTDFVGLDMEVLIDGAWSTYGLGIYRLDLPILDLGTLAQAEYTADAADVITVLLRTVRVTPYIVLSGTNYVTEVQTLLAANGLSHSVQATALTTPADLVFDGGVSDLDICNTLLHGINYQPLWADGRGIARSGPRLEIPTPSADYRTTSEPRLVFEGLRRHERVLSLHNQIGYYYETPELMIGIGRSVLTDADHPASTANKPTLVREQNGDHFANLATMSAAGRWEVLDETNSYRLYSFSSPIDPRINPWTGIVLTYEDDVVETICRVRQVAYPLKASGPMAWTVNTTLDWTVLSQQIQS